jgi:hypothetical protein
MHELALPFYSLNTELRTTKTHTTNICDLGISIQMRYVTGLDPVPHELWYTHFPNSLFASATHSL